jgi:hypothetical protein
MGELMRKKPVFVIVQVEQRPNHGDTEPNGYRFSYKARGPYVRQNGDISFRGTNHPSANIIFLLDDEHRKHPTGVTFHPTAPILISNDGTCPTAFNSSGQFSDVELSEDLLVLSVTNENSDQNTYKYALQFHRTLANGTIVDFKDDPEMENGGGGTGAPLGGMKAAAGAAIKDADDDEILMVEFPVRLRRRRRRDEAEGADDE